MPYEMVVLAKQVPDTKRITGQAMKEDGTVNRAALPAVFNPDDLHALEMALDLRDRAGGRVTVITMGPPRAADILRAALYRGADRVALISDRRFAASDTLATSYALARAVETKVPGFQIVLCGRQAIDGDTAQVGPQTAEKLGIAQVSYAEKILEAGPDRLRIQRNLGNGIEIVDAPVPVLLTVVDTANTPRYPRAKLLLKCRDALSPLELEEALPRWPGCADTAALRSHLEAKGLLIEHWTADDIGAEAERIGLSGSPTKVKKIENIVLAGSGHQQFPATDEGIRGLVRVLVGEHTFG